MKSIINDLSFHRMLDVRIDDFKSCDDFNYVDLMFSNEREEQFELTLFCSTRVDLISMLDGLREQITNTLQELDNDA